MSVAPVNFTLIETDTAIASLRDDVMAGLSARQKTLPAKWLYDEQGSELFEAICDLPEYYVTRTELAILTRHLDSIAVTIAPGSTLIEPGSGAGIKTRLLIESAAPRTYVAIDISRSMLEIGTGETARQFPDMRVVAIHADYTRLDRLPASVAGGDAPATVYFPGSTIGNFTPAEVRGFLERVARWLGPTGSVLIGVDTKKDPAVLEAAYDDSQGVTARFNLNLLARLNAEIDAVFDLQRFRHRARYNAELGRVEMHLESLIDQQVRVGGRLFMFRRGETIHTESSCKYTPGEFRELAASAGFACHSTWTDEHEAFAIYHLAPAAQMGAGDSR